MTIQFQRTVPIFRIFSLEKAREFYVDFLGFKVDWEGNISPGGPLYMQISRGGLTLHLSEHYGDATPGSTTYVYTAGVRELHRELNDKNYRHMRPGLQQQEWGMTEIWVTDPFGNHIRFGEPTVPATT